MLELVILSPGPSADPLLEVMTGLESRRVRLRIADSVAKLWRQLGRKSPDAVLLHFEVGDGTVDGRTALAHLRSNHASVLVVAMGERGDAGLVAEATQLGASDFVVCAPPFAERVGTLLNKLEALKRLVDPIREQNLELIADQDARYRMVGDSPQLREVVRKIRRVAKVPRPVLLMGERGTGKELVARAIHREAKTDGPFLAVNCAAVAETLLESELFGYEKGAFTGAARMTPGKFEQASGGTLFLDEIGNMSLTFQRKILRVVEYGSFTRVGGQEEIQVATRIIGATNADLEKKMRSGEFLPDLYDRLAFEVIRIPPLREREGEIEVLAQFFLDQFMKEVPAFAGKRLSPEAVDILHRYPFPGNVRELKNIIERAVYRDTTNELNPEDIGMLPEHRAQHSGGGFKERVSVFERQLIHDALKQAGGNQAEAARVLSISYHQFRHYVKKHGM